MRRSTRAFIRHGRLVEATIRRVPGLSFHTRQPLLQSPQSLPTSHSRIERTYVAQQPEEIIFYNPIRQTFHPIVRENEARPSLDADPLLNMSNDTERRARAFVAIGGNLGNRMVWIERALRELKSRGITIKRTSSLWETEPMYVTDQDAFLNGVIEIETTLEPTPLLRVLQHVENILGRHKIQDKGPRNIDLDILLYDNIVYKTEDLIIPHALMLEREFVLRPLAELIPNQENFHPGTPETPSSLLAALPAQAAPMHSLSFLHSADGLAPPVTPRRPAKQTTMMCVLNRTPDSFSDGGMFLDSNRTAATNSISQTEPSEESAAGSEDALAQPSDLDICLATVRSWKNLLRDTDRPPFIIDIGGQSTAPGAAEVTAEEEIARVTPLISRLQNAQKPKLISIDTYRASVARAALDAGAHLVNDVSAGTMDPNMLSTVAEAGCSIILMHMRGTPATMKNLCSYPDGLIPTIAAELLERVRAAEEAGIFRWRIILDPGIGFAKTAQQNLEILRNFEQLRNWPGLEGFPWLVGSSRKGFIGKITDRQEAKDRGQGSMVTVAAAIQGGADIVRVHDVELAQETIKMADAIWRGWKPKVTKIKGDDATGQNVTVRKVVIQK